MAMLFFTSIPTSFIGSNLSVAIGKADPTLPDFGFDPGNGPTTSCHPHYCQIFFPDKVKF
jgi:hypothetical protein